MTGTLRGRVRGTGRMLRLVPGDRSVRVREVQVHGRTVESAGRGRIALNLAGVEPAELHRGSVLTDDPAVVASDRIARRAPGAALGQDAGADPCRHRRRSDAAVGPERARRARPAGRSLGGHRPARRPDRGRGRRPMRPAPAASGRDRIVGAVVSSMPMPARGVSRRRQTAERVGPAGRRGSAPMTAGARRAARPPRSARRRRGHGRRVVALGRRRGREPPAVLGAVATDVRRFGGRPDRPERVPSGGSRRSTAASPRRRSRG